MQAHLATALATALACLFLSAAPVAAKEFVLVDSATSIRDQDRSISSKDLGVTSGQGFSISTRTLHGGKQEGVEVIEVDNGRMTFSVIPTRGMNVFRVQSGDVTLGWDSPVDEIVNPAFVNLDSRNGLGWLDGFNEMLVRCGFEWAGHPGMDDGKLLTLHGRAGNTPASKVVVVVDDEAPHRIHVRGRVDDKVFKFVDYEAWTDVSTEPGSSSLRISDTLTNRADYEREFQLIYHGNFGPPLLEEGSRFVAAVKQVTPFNDDAAKDLATWTTYRGPTKGFGEQVYNVVPYAKDDGSTTVMLRNRAADRGVAISYDVNALPYFSLWKNTDTLKEGYVTGLEPGTGFAYPRRIERRFGRVPKLAPGASRSFVLDYAILFDQQSVDATARDIAAIEGERKTTTVAKPEVASESE
ncbi:MAG: aldose 1-epimerase family protein [Rhodospirillales bacterium]|nr:aldose 1-epimerase family protein [Rhodospirillales bacterium]